MSLWVPEIRARGSVVARSDTATPREAARRRGGNVHARAVATWGMDTDHLLAVAPHYVALFLLLAGVLAVVDVLVGPLGFWAELAVVVAIAFLYRPLVLRLGVAPEPWR